MNRTDRLYALVEDLRARAPRLISASELAQRFEVSTRTIQRDLLALQEGGVPIWAQPGPNGGYSLLAEATLPPLNFTVQEAVTITTALAATKAMPFPKAGRTALNKLASAMAQNSKAEAASLAARIRVTTGLGGAVDLVPNVIHQALVDEVAIDMRYRKTNGEISSRTIEPAGLLATLNGWYLVAWCRLRRAPRTFRLDRIAHLRLTTEQIQLPELDDLLRDLPHELAQPALSEIAPNAPQK